MAKRKISHDTRNKAVKPIIGNKTLGGGDRLYCMPTCPTYGEVTYSMPECQLCGQPFIETIEG